MSFWVIIGNEALILSHYAIVPGLAISIAKGYIPEAGSILAMTLVSTLYHLCQAGNVCALPFTVLQTSDHFFVYSTLVWLVLFFSDATVNWRYVAFILIQAVLLPMILYFMNAVWLSGVAIGLPVIVGFVFIALMRKWPKYDLRDLIPGILLLGIGIFFHIYGGDPGTTNYAWAHSIWHVTSMLSIYFILESKDDKFWLSKLINYSKKKKNKKIDGVHVV